MALKDWKRVNSFIWVRKDESKAIIMSQKGFEKKFTFNLSVKDNETGHYTVKEGSLFPYSDKSRALQLAKQYMRSH